MKSGAPLRSIVALTLLALLAASGFAEPADAQKEAAKKADDDAVAQLLKPDTGVGAKYGARDPYKCESAKEPRMGSPTSSQIRAYVIAGAEHEKGAGTSAVLMLTENVTIEVGKGRPWEQDDGADDIDKTQPVYPVKGTITLYTCHQLNVLYKAGKNCTKVEMSQAVGLCYKTTLGTWKCALMDVKHHERLDGWFPAPK